MYDIIQTIIDHTWQTNTSDQQYIYYIAGALIIIFSSDLLDWIHRLFSSFLRSK